MALQTPAVRSSACHGAGFKSGLPNFAASPTNEAVNQPVRSLLHLLALLWLAMGMTAPVSAWTAHSAAHAVAQVSVDEHHHHGVDGKISVHEHDDGEAPDGGHDHMPSLSLSVATIPLGGVSLTAPTTVRQIYMILPSALVERHPSDGLRRPPRLG